MKPINHASVFSFVVPVFPARFNCKSFKKNEFYLFEICDKKEILSKESININVSLKDFSPADNDRINVELSSNGLRVFNQKLVL